MYLPLQLLQELDAIRSTMQEKVHHVTKEHQEKYVLVLELLIFQFFKQDQSVEQ